MTLKHPCYLSSVMGSSRLWISCLSASWLRAFRSTPLLQNEQEIALYPFSPLWVTSSLSALFIYIIISVYIQKRICSDYFSSWILGTLSKIAFPRNPALSIGFASLWRNSSRVYFFPSSFRWGLSGCMTVFHPCTPPPTPELTSLCLPKVLLNFGSIQHSLAINFLQ